MQTNEKLFSELHKQLNKSDKSITMLLDGISKINTSEMNPELASTINDMRSNIPGIVSEMKKSGDPMAVYKKIELKWLSGLQK